MSSDPPEDAEKMAFAALEHSGEGLKLPERGCMGGAVGRWRQPSAVLSSVWLCLALLLHLFAFVLLGAAPTA